VSDPAESASPPPAGRAAAPRMWRVRLTVAGQPVPLGQIRAALERLVAERPFLMTARYARDRAEVGYWEEADYLEDAAALALRLWGEHRVTARLPRWQVVGLEVLERQVSLERGDGGTADLRLTPDVQVAPF
jgi:hypothetical protein